MITKCTHIDSTLDVPSALSRLKTSSFITILLGVYVASDRLRFFTCITGRKHLKMDKWGMAIFYGSYFMSAHNGVQNIF